MFIPGHFEKNDREVLLGFMAEHPFATLVINTADGVEANHLPVVTHTFDDGTVFLQGHVAKQNPLWKAPQGTDALVIFHGPHAYVTPSAYPTKAEHGRVVPTWNYIVAHARGPIRFRHESAWKLDLVERLTRTHEAELEEPWSVSDAPGEYTDKMLNALVGFEVEVRSLEGKWKLSQNQPEINRVGVIAAFRSRNERQADTLAAEMESSEE